MERRLREVSEPVADPDSTTVVMSRAEGPVPMLDRMAAATSAGGKLAALIEQSGVHTTPSAIIAISVCAAVVGGLLGWLLARQAIGVVVGAVLGLIAPTLWLMRRRSVRLKRFEEQFPEGLDLMSRAIRAGHAFQTALGMVADELPAPVGPEFKKTFDRQNFGLPLRDAMNEMADRIPIMDVRFFVTAVAIQRETGGNLAEILDNLAHVVRERFKIRRQVRVHTAHGRFTGYVLLALPAALAVALSFIAPDQMNLLFTERMGRLMLVGAMVLQTIGFVWIRKVIKIEV
jgi:tight adherence protein B